jgi:hypothetical protein
MDKNTVDINVRVLNRTGLFTKEYKMWILHGDDTSKTNNFVPLKTFWENAVQIAVLTAIPASQHGYGMAATDDNESAHLLTYVVSNFGMAYAATQESLRSNAANILAIQGQLQMLCQAVGTSQPPQQQPGRPWNRRNCCQQCGGHNGGSNSGYNIGSDGYSGSSSGGNANGSGYSGSGGGGNGGGYGSSYGGSNGGHQTPSSLPPLPVKQYKNWNYCFTHDGDVDKNHTSRTCACPGENHQRAATCTSTMGGNMRHMNKTILPSTVSRCPAPTRSPPQPINSLT